MREAFRTFEGVMRSLRIYYGNRARRGAMDTLYRGFLRPDDLAFDIGAHVGDRVASFRRLGARVVAVEPQPALMFTPFGSTFSVGDIFGGDTVKNVDKFNF